VLIAAREDGQRPLKPDIHFVDYSQKDIELGPV
jgi:hypothetical protein